MQLTGGRRRRPRSAFSRVRPNRRSNRVFPAIENSAQDPLIRLWGTRGYDSVLHPDALRQWLATSWAQNPLTSGMN